MVDWSQYLIGAGSMTLLAVGWVGVQAAWKRSFPTAFADPDVLAGRRGLRRVQLHGCLREEEWMYAYVQDPEGGLLMESVKHLQDYDIDTRFPATVIASERITPEESQEEVREIVLEISRPDFEYQVGQSIGVVAPGGEEFGAKSHFRLYSVADLPEKKGKKQRIKIAVRRCFYVDEYSGESYPGIASNYLCDLKPGDEIQIAGPFGLVFEVPREANANLILIGSGTGIAPFRAFVKHIYHHVEDWHGRIWLFYGARSGLELLYMNRWKDDFTQYYDREMFEAFRAVSPRPHWADPIAWDRAMEERSAELWKLFGLSNTYVYVAGIDKMLVELDQVFSKIAGSAELWNRRKAELRAGGRWVELVY